MMSDSASYDNNKDALKHNYEHAEKAKRVSTAHSEELFDEPPMTWHRMLAIISLALVFLGSQMPLYMVCFGFCISITF